MTNAVSFSISLPRNPVKTGHRIIMNMELGNTGSSPVYVNCRFAIVPEIGDVWVTIRKGEAQIPFRLRVKLRPIKSSDFLLLAPGEITVAGYDIAKGFSLNGVGEYTVAAEYVSETVPEELIRENVFRGRQKAQPEILVIV